MTFSVDDYEKAIARIFDHQGHVIGTGFLIAPGYVLTCAHVVLQAIGVESDKFSNYLEKPQEFISLDFPTLGSGQPIQAKVIEWSPYSLESGDVAVIRLSTPQPEGVRPIPFGVVSASDVEKEEHFVYGFGDKLGCRSDDYRPKITVAGARFQLCKVGNPHDETIQAGFSGAPVWNQVRTYVIGMVATAIVVTKDEQKSKAYAIPTKQLRPILKRVDALCLHDVLMQSLEACCDADRHPFQTAIADALQRCNPNGGDRPWQEQLIDLSTDLAPNLNWESEGRLVQFAVMLAWMEGTSQFAYDQLKGWVEQQNGLVEQQNLNFAELLERITREMKQQKVSPTNGYEHLMVAVERVETSDDEFRVSMWAIPERSTYNPYNPPKPMVSEHILSTQKLPIFLRQTIRDKIGKETPTINLFMPRTLFDCGVEMLPANDRGRVLGSEYSFVIRTNLKAHPISHYYYDDWHEKWEQVENAFNDQTCKVIQSIDCSLAEADLITTFETTYAAMLEKCESVGELFELVSEETALPVALWSRDPDFQAQLTDVLDCIFQHLPERIRQERRTAGKSKGKPLLGHHLSLVWEDPKILPPDMQFDQEAW